MSPLTPPIPTILIGIHTEIARPVAEGLRPDWDIIRFIQSFPAATSDLPYLLTGRVPPTPPTNDIGSTSFSPNNPTSLSPENQTSSPETNQTSPYNPPENPSTNSPSFSPTNPPRAVLLGRGFTQKEAEALFSLFKDASLEPVLWVAGATANLPGGRELPHGFAPPAGIEKIMVPAFRGALERWRREGGRRTELVFY